MDYDKGGQEKDNYTLAEVEQGKCPLCRTSQFDHLYTERGVLGVVRCLSCGLIYVNPRLKNPERVYWGQADKYFEEAKLIFSGFAKHHRDVNYLEDLRRIKRFKPSGRLLDIGTNMGFFLRMAKGQGWDLYGVEPSPSLSEMARKYFGLNIKNAYLKDAGFESNYFDVVTMTDVFEHIADPAGLLNEIKRILKPDGILFIKVPNGLFNLFKLRMAKLTGRLKDYDIFDSYEHVIHYSGALLKKMLQQHGFKITYQNIGRPIQLPVWHNYVGAYYQYPCPWRLDYKRQTARRALFYLSKIEFYLSGKRVGYLAPNIVVIARKDNL